MKTMSLPNKLFIVLGFALVLVGLASFAILYRAQKHQATQEMDSLLNNDAIALSALVNGKPDGKFEFEITPAFLDQYQSLKPDAFFRFIDLQNKNMLRESRRSPQVECNADHVGIKSASIDKKSVFRVKTFVFRPEIDIDWKGPRDFQTSPLCLVIGLNEAPYWSVVAETLFSTIPPLVILFILLAGVLMFFVKRMTRDLSRLALSLETSDFSATHEFPILPEAETLEVKALSEKLLSLHVQAAEVYREMWLFLGRAAHQIKTPVAAMQATLDVLMRKDRSKEELLAGLADVKTAANLLTGLTGKLISSSRISYQSNSKNEPIDILEFFTEQAAIFDSLGKAKGVSLKLESSNSVRIRADYFLLSELFGNLIENAILYSVPEKKSSVLISWKVQNGEVIVLISDQGPGIPEQVKSSMFAPFIRGDERMVGGSGLGLSIAKRSADLLNANILLIKSDAHGTEFSVRFDLADD
jgi:signal transduction histidine kinase